MVELTQTYVTMVCNEEIYNYFRTLPGTKRIELVCGLLELCIPLEVRFFHSYVQDLIKKECNIFREAEQRANAIPELEKICQCDLLTERMGDDFEDDMHVSTSSVPIGEMNGGGDVSSSAELQQNSTHDSNPELANIGVDGVGGIAPPTGSLPNKTILLNNYPSRSRLIISLCLLEPSNSPCSNIAYDLIRNQLQLATIISVVWGVMVPKNLPIDKFCEEVLLLLTIAVNHPAFTYEQRDIMNLQKKEIETYFSDHFPLLVPTAPQYLCSLLPPGLTQISPAPSISSVSSIGAGSVSTVAAAGAFVNNAVVPLNAQSPVAAVSLLGNSLTAMHLTPQPIQAVTVATTTPGCLGCTSPPMGPSYLNQVGGNAGPQSSSSPSSDSVSPKSSPNSGAPSLAGNYEHVESNNTDNWPKLTTLEGHQLQHNHPPPPPMPTHHHSYINNYLENVPAVAGKNKPNMANSPPKSHSMSSSTHHTSSQNARNRHYRDRNSSGSSSAHHNQSQQHHVNHASDLNTNADDRGMSSSPPSSATSTTSNAGNSSSCYNCGKAGHRANQCPASAATSAGEA